jgi:hypothetical protein
MQDTSSSTSLTTREEACSRSCAEAAGTQELGKMRATVCASCCSSRCRVDFLVILAMGALAAAAKTLNQLQRYRTELFSWRFLICHLLHFHCTIANLLSLSDQIQKSARSVEHMGNELHIAITILICHNKWTSSYQSKHKNSRGGLNMPH